MEDCRGRAGGVEILAVVVRKVLILSWTLVLVVVVVNGIFIGLDTV